MQGMSWLKLKRLALEEVQKIDNAECYNMPSTIVSHVASWKQLKAVGAPGNQIGTTGNKLAGLAGDLQYSMRDPNASMALQIM